MVSRLTACTLLLVGILAVLSAPTIAPVLPQIQQAHADNPQAEFLTKFLLSVPALFIALAAPVAGWIVDKIGRRKLLLICLLLYGIGGSAGLYTTSLGQLLIFRAILGMATGGIVAIVVTLIADYYTEKKREKFMGYQAAWSAIGGILFLVFAGILASVSWRAPFGLYLVGIFLFPLAYYFLPEPTHHQLHKSQTTGNVSRWIWLVYFIGFVFMILFFSVPVQLPFILVEQGIAPAVVGLTLATANLAGSIASFNFRRLKSRFALGPLLGTAFVLMAIGYGLLYLASSLELTIVSLAIAGFGFGMFFPSMNLWIVSLVPVSYRGRAVGGLGTAFFLGEFVSPLLVHPLSVSLSATAPFIVSSAVFGLLALGFFTGIFRSAH